MPAAPVVPSVPAGQPVMTSEPGVPDGAVHMPKMVEVHLISAYLTGQLRPVQAKVHVSNRTCDSRWTEVLKTKQARRFRGLGISYPKLLSRCGLPME